MSKYTLTYEKNKSQEIYIEKIGEGNNESLYFNQEYKEARKLIKEIVDSQGTLKDEEDERNKKKEKIKNYGCNNRVLFTGQRGCGKTSVMRSLADYLSKSNPKPTLVDKDGNEFPTDFMFCCLPMVDPSHFDNNNNILLTVITSMFSEAKKKMNKDKDGGDTDKREGLLKQFEKVFKSLDSIKSELTSYTLESLNRKSDAEDLKDKMKDLVQKYLKFQGCGDESRLILLIDDIDMSVSYAPEMLEQLRKYLELDNLIILMSANLGQLSNEMREKYSSAFQYTLKDSNQALSIDVEDLATKYLLKLFPTSRRVNVERHVSQLLKTTLKIMDAPQNGKKDGKETKEEPTADDDFQKVILSLIWSKTRLLFIPKDPENTLHPVIPTNLRDLAQFLDMLTALKDVGSVKKDEKGNNVGNVLFASAKDYDECEHNLQVFKNYVMKTWIPNHLKVDEELVFHNIPSDISEINKHLINSINVIGTKHKDDLMSRQVGLDIIEKNADNVFIDRDIYTMVSPNDPKFVKANKISDIFNQPSNYSYGDLLLMIDKYETYFESEEHRGFTDAIKIYYSILLFETMFFKSQKVNYDYKDGEEYAVIPVQRLIGGNVYYPNYFEIITDKNFNQKGPSFDAKRAFYHKVKVDNGNKIGDGYPLFAVLYYGDIRPDRYEKDHIYDTTFEKNANVDGVDYVTFDILSILNNMLNPCHTLSRIDKQYRDMIHWNSFTTGIAEWGKKNNIGNASIPDAILPFYSVDMMLNYLRKDYRVSEICTPPGTKSAKDLADDYYFFFRETIQIQKDGSNTTNSEGCEEIIEAIWKSICKHVNSNDELKAKTLEELKNNICALIAAETITEEKNNLSKVGEIKNLIVSNNTRKINQLINTLDESILSRANKEILKKGIKELSDTIKKLNEIKNKKSPKTQYVLESIIISLQSISSVDIEQLKQYLLQEETKKRVLSDFAYGKYGIIKSLPVCDDVKKALDERVCNLTIEQYAKTLDDNTITQSEFDEINNLLKQYNNGKSFKELLPQPNTPEQPVFTDESQVNTFVEYINVIIKAFECYYRITNECHNIYRDKIESITDLYKNRIIALVLGIENQYMGKKEKENLVKEIHKQSSVSEAFCHLVEVLWKNSITELCIRGVIQKEVRSPQAVRKYYRKLWEKTKDMLSSIDHSSSGTLVSVYEKVFNDAEKIFIQ